MKEQNSNGHWLEIFRTGRHTDASGNTRNWTEKDLRGIASLYNPSTHEAPIVIGHPQHDAPAYGWVKRLKVEGQRLKAEIKDLAPEFIDWVRRGLYKKVSIALYPDMGLRHIGFLGATPPAVKGLRQAAFSEEATLEIELEPNNQTEGGMGVKEFIEKLKALILKAEKEFIPAEPQAAGPRITEADIEAAERRGRESTFAEAEKAQREKAELEARVKSIEAEKRRTEIGLFCEGLSREGRLTPALRKLIEPVMIALSGQAEPIAFSEGVKKPGIDGLKEFLKALPKSVTFGEVAGGEGPLTGTDDEKKKALISAYLEKHPEATYKDAVLAVAKEHPELFQTA